MGRKSERVFAIRKDRRSGQQVQLGGPTVEDRIKGLAAKAKSIAARAGAGV